MRKGLESQLDGPILLSPPTHFAACTKSLSAGQILVLHLRPISAHSKHDRLLAAGARSEGHVPPPNHPSTLH